MKHARFALVAAVLLALLAACDQDPGPGAKAPQQPPPVTVATPLQKRITEWDEFTGRFVAVESVEVRARVSGFLESIHFKDGQMVEKGDLLFIIDPRPFEIALEQARAQVEQSKALLQIAESDVARAEPLVAKRTITGREFETRQLKAREAAAVLAANEARVKDAELSLKWTQVYAPVAGRISDTPVDVGNLISGGQADSTVLTRIVSLDPIHFVFEGSEADHLKYIRLDRTGQRESARSAPHPVAVKLIDEVDFVHRGQMDFVDNALDPKSGTIKARAIFDNKDLVLVPGMFGRLRLFGGKFDALLIPDSAIASDQARKIVMTVTSDGTVVAKQITLGPIVDGLRVVRKGLNAADKIVISGLQRARPGQKVTPETGEISSPAPATN